MSGRPLRITSIVGARPEFVQAACVCQAFARRGHREVLIHTGQHYDDTMSATFFDELSLPAPARHLGAGGGSHASQTAAMLVALERVLLDDPPDAVLVRGDTNSTLAGALAAAKLAIPVVHIEAGERCGDLTMPEEINRVMVDHVASLHLCASRAAVARLRAEGLDGAVFVGDVMHDVLLLTRERAAAAFDAWRDRGLEPGAYALATIHRASNTDDPRRLARLVDALSDGPTPVVFPCHPRTARALETAGLAFGPRVTVLPPVGYLDMLALEMHAAVILTDSGGVQREAYCLGVPCVTLRDATEWTETVDAGWNVLGGDDRARILEAWQRPTPTGERPGIFGDGHAADHAVRAIEAWMAGRGHRHDGRA